VERVREIVHMARLLRPPGLPPLLEGFLNLEGTAVPVVRLGRLFGQPEEPPGLYTPLLILSAGDRPLALMAEEITGLLSVEHQALVPVQEDRVFNNCVEAEIRLDGRLVHLLSAERLLLEEERLRLAQLQEAAQRRLKEVEEWNS
jgi:purine-binding chemotaxis protein CheW